MKQNKILAIAFAVLAVMLYTMAVVDFTIGKTGNGISNLLMAVSDTLFAYVMLRIERQREELARITGVLINTFKKLEDGIDVEMIVHKDDDEDEADDLPPVPGEDEAVERMSKKWDELLEKNKPQGDYKDRMKAELIELIDRANKLGAFLTSDTFKTLDDEKQELLKKQKTIMEDYIQVLGDRCRLEGIIE